MAPIDPMTAQDVAPKPMSRARALRVLVCVVAALFYSYCAALQGNDPDPAPWIMAYGLPAVLWGLFAARRLPPALPLSIGAVAALLTLWWGWEALPVAHVSDLGLQMADDHRVEVVREMMGLATVALGMGVLGAWCWWNRPTGAR